MVCIKWCANGESTGLEQVRSAATMREIRSQSLTRGDAAGAQCMFCATLTSTIMAFVN